MTTKPQYLPIVGIVARSRSIYRRIVTRCIYWLFPWLAPTPVMSLKDFNRDELWRWIMPDEFSFGSDGLLPGLQPVPPRFRSRDKVDVSAESHELRVRLAVLRKQLGCPPIYWNGSLKRNNL